MAEVEERQFNSLAERIAALNSQKNFNSNGTAAPQKTAKRPPPPPPPSTGNRGKSEQQTSQVSIAPPVLPARPQKKDQPPELPRRVTEPVLEESQPTNGRRLPPPLPGRTNTLQVSPGLPPRRSSTQTLGVRRGSNASDASHISTNSNLSLGRASTHTSATSIENQGLRRLPPTLDQAKLPPLPTSRREREAQAAKETAEREAKQIIKAPLLSIKSAPAVPQALVLDNARPSLPPRLPSRPGRSPDPAQEKPNNSAASSRRMPPMPVTGFSGPAAFRPKGSANRPEEPIPPPVPMTSRPSAAQIDAVAVRPTVAVVSNTANSCLICRDFSQPDAVAAQYPRQNLPRNDPVGYLADVLCGPFPSATDKARAIFTWCHHNLAYNVEEFFGKCVKNRSSEDTIFLGKAVCAGYADVYQAIANRAGLQCVMVVGHGKGYGYTPMKKGQAPPPRDPTGHAWNAVCIDNGEWKLLDACWGAGNVHDQQYTKAFKPNEFYLSNELLGRKHFPQDSRHFYLPGGRIPTWEEYMIGPVDGEPVQWYGTADEEGLNEYTVAPALKHIPANSNEVVRFQVSKVCEHWIPEKHGPGKNYLLMMKIHGVDGRKDDLVPLQTDGFWWWVDIKARDLGAPGQTVWLYGLNDLCGKDVRGLTEKEWRRTIASGSYSMGWQAYASWDLI